MKLCRFILLGLISTTFAACSDSAEDQQVISPKKEEAPLMDLEVISSSSAQGERLMILNDQGKVIYESDNIPKDTQILKSRGFVVFVTQDRSGKHMKAINTLGKELSLDYETLTLESKIFISDGIFAYTRQSTTQGKLIEKKADGSEVYESIPSGLRLYSYNRNGEKIYTSHQIIDDDSVIRISNHLIAFTAMKIGNGKLLKEEGTTKTYEGIPEGIRLYTYAFDGRELPTQRVTLDDETEVIVRDTYVIINGVSKYINGKLLREENGVKVYELIPDGKKAEIYRYDGSIED